MQDNRSSNFELLRIFSMLLIILHHFSVHGSWVSGILQNDVVIGLLASGGKLGVNLFVMISGYFLISSSFKIQSLLKVYFSTLFYSLIIGVTFIITQPSFDMSFENIRQIIFPLIFNEYWFVSVYIALLLISPFLRLLAKSMSKSGYGKLLLICAIILSVLPWVTNKSLSPGNIAWFAFLFLLAGYIRTYSLNIKTSLSLIYLLAALLMLFGLVVFSVAAGKSVMRYAAMNSFLILVLSACIILLFSRINIGSIIWINRLSAGSFSVYLIHDNPFIREWLWPHFAWLNNTNPLTIFSFAIVLSLIIYLGCALIDIIRQEAIDQRILPYALSRRKIASALTKINQWFESISDNSQEKDTNACGHWR